MQTVVGRGACNITPDAWSPSSSLPPLFGSPLVDSPQLGGHPQGDRHRPPGHEDAGEKKLPPPSTEAPPGPPPVQQPALPPGIQVEPLPLLVGQSVRTLSTVVVSPVDRSHTLAVLSPLPVARCRLSGLKAML